MPITKRIISQQLKSIFLLVLWMFAASVSCQTLKQDSAMQVKTIRFIPETFNNLELGYLSGGHNPCSPMYPKRATQYLTNEVLINVPEKIILPSSIPIDSIQPVIPICIVFVITARRGYKYAHITDEIIYVRKTDSECWFSGKLYDETMDGSPIAPPPGEEEWEKKVQKWIAEAQHYPDDSLNEGRASGEYRNLNIFQYVDMPFEPGVYEIYYTLKGFESNRVQVEIVFEK